MKKYCEPVEEVLLEREKVERLASLNKSDVQSLDDVFKHASHPKRKPLVEEISQMVAYVKRLEFLIKPSLLTPFALL